MDLNTQFDVAISHARTPGARPVPNDREAAEEFEAYMVKALLTEMRKTVRSGVFDGGLFEARATRGYEAFVDDALGRKVAEQGSFGLAEQLLRSWEGGR